MKFKKWLKRNQIDGKFVISSIIGILIGTYLISQIQLLTGFYNNYFFLIFGVLYSFIIMRKMDKHLHSLNSGDKIGDKTNL